MAAEKVNYQMVLADLQAKRDSLNNAIAAIEQILGVSKDGRVTTPAQGDTEQPTAHDVTEIPRNAFFGLSLTQAIKKYLGMVLRRQSTAEIVEALKAGGVASESENFLSIVYTALARLEKKGEVVRVGRTWGLAEWAPGFRKGKEESKPEG